MYQRKISNGRKKGQNQTKLMRSIKLQGAWEASKIESQTIYSSLVFPNLCHSKQDNSSEASFVTFLLKKKSTAWWKWPSTATQWSAGVRSPELSVNSSLTKMKRSRDKSLVEEKNSKFTVAYLWSFWKCSWSIKRYQISMRFMHCNIFTQHH